MTFVVALGPALQSHTLPLLTEDTGGLYEAVYPETLARFPSLTDWLIGSLNWQALLLSILVTLTSFRAKTATSFAITSAVTLFVGYTVFDVGAALFWDSEIFSSLPGSIFANLVGGLLVGLIAYLLLFTFAVSFGVTLPTLVSRAWGAICVLAVGIALSATAHIAIRTFYRPLPVQVEVVAKTPFEGQFVNERQAQQNPAGALAFAPLGRGTPVAKVTVASPGHTGTVKWNAGESSRAFRIDVYLASGCLGGQLPNRISAVASFADVRSLTVMDGADGVYVKGSRPMQAFQNVGAGHFWVERDVSGRAVQTFVSSTDSLDLFASGDLEVSVDAYLFSTTSTGRDRSASDITFMINNERHSIRFEPPRTRPLDARLVCEPIRNQIGLPNIVNTPSSAATIHFKIIGTKHPTEVSDGGSSLRISDANGWIKAEGITESDAQYLGDAALMFLDRGLTSFRVAGENAALVPSDSVRMVGKFKVQWFEDDTMRVSGMADALSQNETRLNKTRWEQLSSDWKLPSIGAAFGFFLMVLRMAWGTLSKRRDDDPGEWVP